jgi:hypothetical protein
VARPEDSLVAEQWRIDTNYVSVKFDEGANPAWWFTGVYGLQRDEDKIDFLAELKDVRNVVMDLG